jgi:hypothetical protein
MAKPLAASPVRFFAIVGMLLTAAGAVPSYVVFALAGSVISDNPDGPWGWGVVADRHGVDDHEVRRDDRLAREGRGGAPSPPEREPRRYHPWRKKPAGKVDGKSTLSRHGAFG